MKVERTAQVIETKRKPPLWTVKAEGRYKARFLGDDAKEKALACARVRPAHGFSHPEFRHVAPRATWTANHDTGLNRSKHIPTGTESGRVCESRDWICASDRVR
jgi:hypothetical protein